MVAPEPSRPYRCPTGAGISSICGYGVGATARMDNRRAFALDARLGCAELADRIGLCGDLFLVGIGPDGTPDDVPAAVLSAAERAGLLHAPGPGTTPDDVESTRPCLRQVTTR